MEGSERTLMLLSNLNDEEFKEFIHSCMNEICGRKGPSYASFRLHDKCNIEDFNETVSKTKKLCLDCTSLDLDFDKIKEFIPSLTHNQYEAIYECMTIRKNEIMAFVVTDQISKSENILKDYDWKLKWVVGSSAFSDMHEPLLNLDLHLKSGDENKTLNMELDKAELKLLIEAMEKAQQTMFNR